MSNKNLPLVAFPLAKLLFHLATYRGYGMFRDEFYYLACAERLALGYVDHPPFSVAVLSAVRAVLGDSLFAVRLVPAVAGALTVLLVGLLARRMGGGRIAQSLGMLAALVAPVYLALDHFYSMNAFDMLFWALAAYVLTFALERGDPRIWGALGLVLGLGLLNKISVLWLGFGIFAGLLATDRRRVFLTPGPWIAAGVALVLFVPHLLWQVANGWPTLEFIENATQNKMVEIEPLSFLTSQILMMNPVSLPLWLGGLVWLLAAKDGRPHRLLGVAYLAVFALLVFSGSARAGYLSPAYTWLFAGGGVAVEGLLSRRRAAVVAWGTAALLVVSGVVLVPEAVPVLPVESYVAYADAMGFAPSTEERKELAELPQFYADMHGWEAIVETVAGVYRSLPPEDQARTAIFTFNYGDAGAIDYLGRRHGLPEAIGGHNNYWLWGPRHHRGDVVIVLGDDREGLEQSFEEVELAAVVDCGYCMPYENDRPVWVVRGPRRPLPDIWARVKHYD